MRIPRDVSAKQFIKSAGKLGYAISRQKGSHIRLTCKLISKEEHHITIPDHDPIKIGTLNNILNELALIHHLTKEEIIIKLFH